MFLAFINKKLKKKVIVFSIYKKHIVILKYANMGKLNGAPIDEYYCLGRAVRIGERSPVFVEW